MKKNKLPSWIADARNKWEHTGKVRPAFAASPKPGQRSVWDFSRPPAIEKEPRKIEVKHGQLTLADSTKAYGILETASPPTFYIPPSDVNMEELLPLANKGSFCEWKGKAVYWVLKTAPEQAVAWSYPNPLTPFEPLKDYMAFYPQHLECYLGGERVTPQPGLFYAGWITSDLAGPFKGEPGSGHW